MRKIKLSCLLTALLMSSGPILAGLDASQFDVVDHEYRTACGPISCFVALRALGMEAKLVSLVRECEWQEGKLIPFNKLYDVLNAQPGVACRAARLTPEQLQDTLRAERCVAILPIRKRSQDIDHAVCAIGVDNGVIRIFDYPDMEVAVPDERLADVWDGEALIVGPSAARFVTASWPWFILPMVAIIGLFLHRKSGPASEPLPSPVGIVSPTEAVGVDAQL